MEKTRDAEGACGTGAPAAEGACRAATPAAPRQPETGLDWNALWIDEFAEDVGCDDVAQEQYWDRRAPTFGTHGSSGSGGSYVRGFLDHAALRPGETVIDMGCAVGTLAIPAAQAGHRVTACDLSGKMLELLGERAREAGVQELVDARKMSWLDDWDDLPVADVFFASRSLCSRDLHQTILKMEAHTRRCCCMTLPTADSPMADRTMLAAIGRTPTHRAECVYLVNLLFSMGRLPEFCFLDHVRPSFGATPAELRAEFEMESGPFTPEESAALDAFIAEHFDFGHLTGPGGAPLAPEEAGVGRTGALAIPRRDYDRHVRWAFVKWNVPA